MKKIYVAILATVLLTACVSAQKGNNIIGAGGDLSFPTGDFGTFFKMGAGAYAKAMFGVGQAGQVTFTSGFSSFTAKGSTPDFKVTLGAIPFLAGYRHNFESKFFAEPQVGYSVFDLKQKGDEGFFTDSKGAFTWAATVGYIFNKQIEVSARYQSGSKEGTTISLFGLRVGYNFSLGGPK